ncbi:hypothetical protein AJ79_02660 [Helicocarpus griseus UAMH5409]|uniref:Uncharacterized protein n=1 Tax=Helicocarpus griseus UAMH5409 TaxID=1447875 RepID=A0A2B7Y120_9EURO|nr:hypothetical protein AJ79_02660 [Helicocarpus griseus UAMH5409]
MEQGRQVRFQTKRVPDELDLEKSKDYPFVIGGDTPSTATSSQPLIDRDKFESPLFTPDGPPRGGYKLTRFYIRTVVGILAPLIVTGFWLAIYIKLLTRKTNVVKYGSDKEILIYYAWFVLAVFGVGLSKYGLAGVEVSMLQHPFWQAKNTMVLLMHSGASWGGPDGWSRFLARILTGKHTATHRLWHLLATISLIGSIAIPLSGTCLELADGYVKSSKHPLVSGRTWENFNARDTGQMLKRGDSAWNVGSPITVPGLGIIYTPPYVNRNSLDHFTKLPNSLPLRERNPDFFLTPQSTVPIGGKGWGLRLGYNCFAVKSASEFTVLARKPLVPPPEPGTLAAVGTAPGPPGRNITILSLSPTDGRLSINIRGYARIGINLNNANLYDGSEPSSFDEKDLEHANVLEYALWQIRWQQAYEGMAKDPSFDDNIEPSMTDMYQPFSLDPNGTVVTDESFFGYDEKETLGSIPSHAAMSIANPIGVRCRQISVLGTAELEAQTSTFTNFKQTPSPPFNASEVESPASRFGVTAASILAAEYYTLFTATKLAPPEVLSNSVDYKRFIDPETLVEAVMRAYAMDALQLMYDGIYSNETRASYIAQNLTSSGPGKVLERGQYNPGTAAALFTIWALSSAALGIVYGFRRRWSETLDGYTLFRFGADLAHEVRYHPEFSSTNGFEDCEKLRQLPGLIGDSQPHMPVGHISLVGKHNVAKKDKLYC